MSSILITLFEFNESTTMKKILLLLFLVVAVSSYGQRRGYIEYSVNANVEDSTFDAVMSAALMNKSEFSFLFRGKNRSRMQLKAGSYFNFISIFNYRKGEFLRLVGDQKTKSAQTGEIREFPDSVIMTKSNYTLLEDTMTILGFLCKKAVATVNDKELVCWYTEDLHHTFENLGFINVQVPGLPLFFMTNSGNVTMTFEAVNFDKRLKKKRKLLRMKIPEDYVLVE